MMMQSLVSALFQDLRGSPAAVKAALKILKITQLEDSGLCTKMTSFCRTLKDLKGRKHLRISP